MFGGRLLWRISFLFFAALEFFGKFLGGFDEVLLLLLFRIRVADGALVAERRSCQRECRLAAAFFEVLGGVGDLGQTVVVDFFTSEFFGHVDVFARFDGVLRASCRLFVSMYFDQSEPLFVALDVTVQMVMLVLERIEERILRISVEFLMMVLV